MRFRPRALGAWITVAACLVAAHAAWQAWRVAETPYPAQYDYDEGVYAETAAAAARGERLYSRVFLSQPPLLVDALTGAYRAWGESLAAARALVIIGSLVWLGALFVIPAAAGLSRAGMLAVCAALGSTTFLTAAHTVQMEGPSEALAAAAVAAAVLGARGPAMLWWGAAGALAGLAVLTKLTAAACALPLIVIAVLGVPRQEPSSTSPARRRRFPVFPVRVAALAAGAAAAVAAFLPLIAAPGFIAETVGFHVALARRLGPAPLAHARTLLTFLLRGWPLSAAAAAGLWLAFGRPAGPAPASPDRRGAGPDGVASSRAARRTRTRENEDPAVPGVPNSAPRWLLRALGLWLAAECAALPAITPLWPHHLALLVSPLSLLAGLGADRLWDLRPAALRAAAGTAAGCAAVLTYLAAGVWASGAPAQSAALQRAAGDLARSTPPGAAVVTDDPMVAFLARRPVPPGLIDTSKARVQSGNLRAAMLDAAIGEPGVRAVVLWRGTFRAAFPKFVARAYRQFPLQRAGRRGRAVLLRTSPRTNAASP